MIVSIDLSGEINTKVIDTFSNDEYVLHLMANAVGSFVGKIRDEFESVLLDIKEKCFEKFVFKSNQSQEIINYVKNKYNDELEYLWKKFPSNAIWRRKDNNKWYGALLVVPKNKIGLPGNELIEIIDLRINPDDLNSVIDNIKHFEGYHMNKKHWFTIPLNNSVSTKEICEWIDKSYLLAKK